MQTLRVEVGATQVGVIRMVGVGMESSGIISVVTVLDGLGWAVVINNASVIS
jgi:hypothetical protein